MNIFSGILAIAILASCCGMCWPTRIAAQNDQENSVENTVRGYEQAVAHYDFEKANSLLAPDAQWIEHSYPGSAQFNGRDGSNRWEQYKLAKLQIDYHPRDFVTRIRGEVAWVTLALDSTFTANNPTALVLNDNERVWRGTFVESYVLEKIDGAWRVALGHTSLLPAEEVVSQTKNSDISIRKKVVGVWRLVLAEETLKDGSKRDDYGAHGTGSLIYTASGHMCAQMMNPDRPHWVNAEKPTADEKASTFDTAYGYCGRYEVDAQRHLLVHLPDVSTAPDYVGSRQLRPYRFEGNKMIFSGGTVKDDPSVTSWKYVWEKVD